MIGEGSAAIPPGIYTVTSNAVTVSPPFAVSTGSAAPSAILLAGVAFVPVVLGTTRYTVFGSRLLNTTGAPGALGVVNGYTSFPEGSTKA